MDSSGAEQLSAYEQQRLDNIAQNNKRLEELGIDARPPTRQRSSAPKRPRPAVREPVHVQPTRRSMRQRTAVEHYSDETPLPEVRRVQPERARPYEAPDIATDDDSKPRAPLEPIPSRPPPEAKSARALHVDVAGLLAQHLGKEIPGPATKASVVDKIAPRGAKFSKYAGALEWKNAVVLWVNIGGSDYKNNFASDKAGGLTMTWYASESLHEDSHIVRRLLPIEGGGDGDAEVLLFCRDKRITPSGPYVFCGRLAYGSHVATKRPLKFLWRLLDAETIMEAEAFRALQ